MRYGLTISLLIFLAGCGSESSPSTDSAVESNAPSLTADPQHKSENATLPLANAEPSKSPGVAPSVTARPADTTLVSKSPDSVDAKNSRRSSILATSRTDAKLVAEKERKERFPNGELRRRFVARLYSDGEVVFHGPYVEYYPNGKRFKQGMYVDGKQDGLWGYWHDNGRIAKKGKFILGDHDGIWLYKTSAGHMRRQESYIKGEKDGLWIVYGREPGTKIREMEFKGGVKHGKVVEYFPKTGQKQMSTEWLNGQKHGEEMVWFEDGSKAVSKEYVNGELHGRSVVWAPSGAIRADFQYINGVRKSQ